MSCGDSKHASENQELPDLNGPGLEAVITESNVAAWFVWSLLITEENHVKL